MRGFEAFRACDETRGALEGFSRLEAEMARRDKAPNKFEIELRRRWAEVLSRSINPFTAEKARRARTFGVGGYLCLPGTLDPRPGK